MNDFKDCPRKRAIHEILLPMAGNEHKATVLIGPNADLFYLPAIRKYVTSTRFENKRGLIHGYDLEKVTTMSNIDLIMHYEDIFYAEPTSFIDLDLCGTLTSNKYLMFHLFEKQLKLVSRNKVFMVTFALRGNPQCKSSDDANTGSFIHRCVDAISEMIQRKIKVKKKRYQLTTSLRCDEYITNNVMDYQIKIFSYKDTVPMFTALIKY